MKDDIEMLDSVVEKIRELWQPKYGREIKDH